MIQSYTQDYTQKLIKPKRATTILRWIGLFKSAHTFFGYLISVIVRKAPLRFCQKHMNSKSLVSVVWLYLFITFFQTAMGNDMPMNHTLPREKNLVVEKGQTITLRKKTGTYDKIVVKGTLIIADNSTMELNMRYLVVDGGLLKTGSPDKGREHPLYLNLISDEISDTPSIWVKNNGGLVLHGSLSGQNPTIFIQSKGHGAYIHMESAKTVRISGTIFNGLGVPGRTPAITWIGMAADGAYIKDCTFQESKYVDLYLDKTKALISGNRFNSLMGSSLVCSPSGIGMQNEIRSNSFYNSSGQGSFAIRLNNPYQYFSDNCITVGNRTSGMSIAPPAGYEDFVWDKAEEGFLIENNSIVYQEEDRAEQAYDTLTQGLYVGNFDHSGIWRMQSNTIENFDVGLQNETSNIVIGNHVLANNTIGVMPGRGYLMDSRISCEHCADDQETRGIWVMDTHKIPDPKISNVDIAHYNVGIAFKGQMGEHNYLEKIRFNQTDKRATFSDLGTSGWITDKDGSLMPGTKKGPSAQGMHMEHSGDHNEMQTMVHGSRDNNPEGFVIFSGQSILRTENSQSMNGNPNTYFRAKDRFGILEISTGLGLSDPVHEHQGIFSHLELANSSRDTRHRFSKPGNRHQVFLASNTIYDVLYKGYGNPLFDLSFEWNAPPDQWILLRVPYLHGNVHGLQSFGSLVPESPSVTTLKHSKETSFYMDGQKKMAYIKIYGGGNSDELVLYSSQILTEITIDGHKVPLEMETDEKARKIVLRYRVPLGVSSTLVLTDYHGNTLETLVHGPQANEEIVAFVDMDTYDVGQRLYHYFLTIDDQVHKGPIYRY